MQGLAVTIVLLLAVLMIAGLLRRRRDLVDDGAERARLLALQPPQPRRFDPTGLVDLPESARRFFGFAIAPGTPLLTVAEIDMAGRLRLGTRERPGERPMRARQVLAAPSGFVWSVALRGMPAISGSDSLRWTRFRLQGLLPIARLGGDADHGLSAYGRCVAEALFWTPAALLPGPGVRWEAVNGDTARVTVTGAGFEQAVDLQVAPDGRPLQVSFMRWSNANPTRRFQRQPFGGRFDDFREVQGFRVPFRVRAGNFFGTPAYFEFFDAEVRSLRYPAGSTEPAGRPVAHPLSGTDRSGREDDSTRTEP